MELLLQQTTVWVCFFYFSKKYSNIIEKYGSNTLFLFCTVIFIFTDMIMYTKFNKRVLSPSAFLFWPLSLVLFIVFHDCC